MKILHNPLFQIGLHLANIPLPASDPSPAMQLIAQCPRYKTTPLVVKNEITVKDERTRMGLGAFKATGAAYVIAHMAQEKDISGLVFVTASAGNHGLSVAVGARIFGAQSVVYLSETVPNGFADRLRQEGAQVVIEGQDYQASMDAAQNAAKANGWILLSDSSWPGYVTLPHRLMEGYLVLGAEIAQEIKDVPTHIFLQAGVGGLACAMASFARYQWAEAPRIIIVEPDQAPALYQSIENGYITESHGGVSSMGRLDCKTPSAIALVGLSLHANDFVLISDEEVENQLPLIEKMGLASSPSGAAGLACYLALNRNERDALGIDENSRPLFILSEGTA